MSRCPTGSRLACVWWQGLHAVTWRPGRLVMASVGDRRRRRLAVPSPAHGCCRCCQFSRVQCAIQMMVWCIGTGEWKLGLLLQQVGQSAWVCVRTQKGEEKATTPFRVGRTQEEGDVASRCHTVFGLGTSHCLEEQKLNEDSRWRSAPEATRRPLSRPCTPVL
ncbi:hypothetical protein ZEAMMB73_Zm00001d040096 [Zea mays]|uniref:Uncharacterized protein n=1 Tax=Zea mays TaxID=4577 RepID=A0A1D6MN32_MAIZE|nr:hypothetical protein ZEAMMB73_Zm00001d040096 [Zea mays]